MDNTIVAISTAAGNGGIGIVRLTGEDTFKILTPLPIFTVIWTAVGAIYYFFLSEPVVSAIKWFITNISFSYVLGIFTGVIVIDFIYSTKLYKKIKKFAKNNSIDIMSEKFKLYLKEVQTNSKHTFLNPFKQTVNLLDSLADFIRNDKDKGKK